MPVVIGQIIIYLPGNIDNALYSMFDVYTDITDKLTSLLVHRCWQVPELKSIDWRNKIKRLYGANRPAQPSKFILRNLNYLL